MFSFAKEDFFKLYFSVDSFLRKNKQTELNIIRNDLGLYLKVLRAALIDLINQDYTDFVSLSTNLKCLDRLIMSIVAPLLHLKKEICNKKMLFSSNFLQLKNCYERKCKIGKLRKLLISIFKVNAYLKNLDFITNSAEQITYFERAVIIIAQISYNKSFYFNVKSVKYKQNTDFKNKFWIDLENSFNRNFKINNDEIRVCLRTYILLNSCCMADEIFKSKVKNSINNILSKNITGKKQISIIYNEILDFVALNMKTILFITYYTNEIKGFNFLVNGFWIVVVERFLTSMTSLYVTGNPNLFFNNYLSTVSFMLRIETMLRTKNEIINFRQHVITRNFEKKWNFSVYFQIRYTEIAMDLEKACNNNFKKISDNIDLKELSYISVACDSLTKCWTECPNIYQLFPKYLKFTYHIFSKVIKWTEKILLLQKQKNIANVEKISLLVYLHNNITSFLNFIVEIVSKISNNNPTILLEKILFEKSFEDINLNIAALLKDIEQYIVVNLVSTSSEFMPNVTDVSRLYRKTNRDVPKKHSSYVLNMFEPVDFFQNNFKNQMHLKNITVIIKKFFSQLTCIYYNYMEEALSAVNRTENSLKRLKTVRRKIENDKTTSTRISDDDKIRLQLGLDVNFWIKGIVNRKFKEEEITKLNALNQLVKEATKGINY